MAFILTAFSPKKTTGKVPYSPFDDETFFFETYQFKTNLDFFGAQVSHFLLNIPLEIQKPLRSVRSAKDLQDYFPEKLEYFILDIDKVHSEFNRNKIIDYFKEYRCILGESRSYNGVDNFNMKGIIFLEPVELQIAKSTLLSLKQDIIEFGELDECSLYRAAYNAPILKNAVIFNNEDGKLVKPVIKKLSEFFDRKSSISIDFNSSMDFKNASTIEEFCLMTFSQLGFSMNKTNTNGSLSFNHPSEVKSKGGFFWYQDSPFIMHHPNTLRSVDIFDTVRNSPEGRLLMSTDIDYKKELGLPEQFGYEKTYTFNEEFLEVQNKKEIIREFLHKRNGVLSIKSGMGSGKSNIIDHIIERSHSEDKSVLIITNRISVAEDYHSKYTKHGLKIYNNDRYNIGDSIIVQFDSLYRYSIKYFDVIVIDEFMSLMIHARNNLTETNSNIIKLFGSFNKKLVIADAFLTGYEQTILQKTENTILIDNEYKDSTELLMYKNKAFFVTEILRLSKLLKGTEKISISCTSIGMINGLRYILEKAGISVVALTADTPSISKKIVYDLFSKKEHDKFQVVIYSPTLTVGVSNINNVQHHFHYDGSMSCDVISSVQMIKRSRNAKYIHMYIKEKININKITYESLKDFYMQSTNKRSADSYIFEMDNYGDMNLSPAGKKAIKIDVYSNILEFNHRAAFIYLLGCQFRNEIKEVQGKSEAVIDSIIKEINKHAKDKNLKYIDDYFKLTGSDKASILTSKYINQEETVFKKFIEIEETLNVPFGMLEEVLEAYINDSNLLTKINRYNIFQKNLSEVEIRTIQATNISMNKQEELVFLNDLIEFSKNSDSNKIIKSFYTQRELQNDKLLQKIIKAIGYEKDKHGVTRFPDRIQKFTNFIS